ncbi:kelch-like protein 2 isoform X2 [Paramacrobiotus metropolitanus]|uniref:kelch-like protein 2 isoform X2 n=1 Tax=Paramacrobiotus metropolitanus TaxID=2943436 RepID=UPI0024462D8A|nr:kelch-like protein 2 isoform X2 [Paramacrobiotus metropolitanus]
MAGAELTCHISQCKLLITVVLCRLVKYAYTLDLSLNENNVEVILIAAEFLQMTTVAKKCWKFVEEHMSLSNCLLVYALASNHANPYLAEKALTIIHPHFLRLAHSQDFLQMDAQQLNALIASDDVEVFSEDEVWEAVLRWLDYGRPERLTHLHTVLQSVRVSSLTDQCRQEYVGTLASVPTEMPPPPSGLAGMSTQNTTPRHSFVLVCLGGGDKNEKGAAVEIFCPSIPAVWRLKEFPLRQDCLGAVMLDDRWMMISSKYDFKTIEVDNRYTGLREEWGPPVADMQTPRHSAGLAVLNGRVYVAGGCTPGSGEELSSVEAYDFRSNSWSAVASLPVALRGLHMMGHSGLLYAVGGVDKKGRASSLVFAYSPAVNAWRRLADMPTPRYSCSACLAPSGLIYVVEKWTTKTSWT